jgi:hypothetical protein
VGFNIVLSSAPRPRRWSLPPSVSTKILYLITPWRQNPKFHCRIHKNPSTIPIPSQVNPLHTPQPISLRSILIPSSHLQLCLSSGLFLSGFPTKTFYVFLSSSMHTTCLAQLIFLDLIHLIYLGMSTNYEAPNTKILQTAVVAFARCCICRISVLIRST